MTDRPHPEPTPEPAHAPEAAEPDVRQATVRRAPKWGAFIVVGMLFGLIATIAVTTAFPADPMVGMTMLVFVNGLFGVSAGAALGALAALLADRVSRRRAQAVTVERGEVRAAPREAAEASETAPAGPEPTAPAEAPAAEAPAADPAEPDPTGPHP